MALVRNETDSRIRYLSTSYVGTAAVTTQLPPVMMAGLPAASVYIANVCTAAVHYDVKGCYDKEAATAYWYSIVSGTAAVNEVTCIGPMGGGKNTSSLGNCHRYLTVEYFATAATSGGFIVQLGVW